MQSRNERVELEMRILRYRQIARRFAHDPEPAERIKDLVRKLEKQASRDRRVRPPQSEAPRLPVADPNTSYSKATPSGSFSSSQSLAASSVAKILRCSTSPICFAVFT